jgi:hypothetical protein
MDAVTARRDGTSETQARAGDESSPSAFRRPAGRSRRILPTRAWSSAGDSRGEQPPLRIEEKSEVHAIEQGDGSRGVDQCCCNATDRVTSAPAGFRCRRSNIG